MRVFFFFLVTTLFFIETKSQVSNSKNLVDNRHKSTQEIIKSSENSVFVVYGEDVAGNVISQGSGFFISTDGTGITNYHVLASCEKGFIKLKSGIKAEIDRIIDYNEDYDLIKFKIKNEKNLTYRPLKISQRIPVKGEEIVSISNPLGLEQTISVGIVSAIRELSPYGTLIQITAPISEGSSGSPIINTFQEIIGVATLSYKGGQNLNFAVSANKIAQLNKNKNMPISQMGKNPLETSLVKSAIESYLKGDLTVAQNLLFQELKTNILNHLALNLFAQVFLDRKEYEKAIEYFYKAYEQDPTNYNYLNSFGVANAQYCYINGGDSSSFELAYAAYTKALEINAEFELAYFNRAFLIINCLYNLNLASDLFNNSIIYDALKDLNKLIEINPFSAKAFYLRSIIKYNFKDSWSALADADKSIDLDKYNFEYYFNRATIKNLGIGDYKNGLIDLNISYELTTDNQKKADIKGSSSVCKYQLGDINGACSDAREAYRLSNSITYQELISRFCQ